MSEIDGDSSRAIAHAREQAAAIAEFGCEAFRSNDLQGLLTKAAGLAAKGLEVERSKVLVELRPSGDQLLIRAGVGWKDGVVGRVTVGADIGSAAGYALLTGRPVISDDVEHDDRFRYPEVLRQHGIKSAVNVIIQGREAPFGVLEIDSQRSRSFTAEDINFLQSFANLLAAAIERLRTHRELAEAAAQKDVLLHELQHRIKNGLQIILGFISTEKRRHSDETIQHVLDALSHRVDALGVIYRKLSLAQQGGVELGDYLAELCSTRTALISPEESIRLDTKCVALTLDLDQALPLALIANEFMLNSLKHAFPAGQGAIKVHLELLDNATAQLVLADNGIGAPGAAQRGKGSGLHLIEQLAKQAHASLSWDTTAGTAVTLVFPVIRTA